MIDASLIRFGEHDFIFPVTTKKKKKMFITCLWHCEFYWCDKLTAWDSVLYISVVDISQKNKNAMERKSWQLMMDLYEFPRFLRIFFILTGCVIYTFWLLLRARAPLGCCWSDGNKVTAISQRAWRIIKKRGPLINRLVYFIFSQKPQHIIVIIIMAIEGERPDNNKRKYSSYAAGWLMCVQS